MGSLGTYRIPIRRGSIREFFAGDPYLKGCWSLDGHARDESGNGNHGTVSGAIPYTGKFGTAYKFDGINDYINLGNPASLQITGAMTIFSWIKTSVTGNLSCSYRDIVAKGSVYVNNLFYAIGVRFITSIYLYFVWRNATSAFGAEAISLNLDNQQYHFIVGVRDDSNNPILYVDGNRLTNTTLYGAGVPTDSGLNVYIGWGAENADDEGAFPGSIDETAIFNRALSPSEISQYYQWAISEPRKYWFYNPTILNQQQVLMGGGLSDGITLMGGY